MPSQLEQQEDDVIVRPNAHLADRAMTVYDKQHGRKVRREWDQLDYPLDRLQGALQMRAGRWQRKSSHRIVELTPISNQGRAGSCVANAWCDALEILDGLDGTDEVEQLSRRFLYWTSRAYTGDTHLDEGTFIRAAAHQLNKVGVVQEKWFPYSDREDHIVSGGEYATPKLSLHTMASNNRLAGFYRAEMKLYIEEYLDSLELAIRANHPFVFGAPVSKLFTKQRGMATFDPPRNQNDIVGWHAMICVGVKYDGDQRLWLIRNSWGSAWGENGHIKVTDAYVRRFRDVWVGTKMSELI